MKAVKRTRPGILGWLGALGSGVVLASYTTTALLGTFFFDGLFASTELDLTLASDDIAKSSRLLRILTAQTTQLVYRTIPEIIEGRELFAKNQVMAAPGTADITASADAALPFLFSLYEYTVRQRYGGIVEQVEVDLQVLANPNVLQRIPVSEQLLHWVRAQARTMLLKEAEINGIVASRRALLNARRSALDQHYLIARSIAEYFGLPSPERPNRDASREKDGTKNQYVGKRYKTGILAGLPVVTPFPDDIKSVDQLISLTHHFGGPRLSEKKAEVELKLLSVHLAYRPVGTTLANYHQEMDKLASLKSRAEKESANTSRLLRNRLTTLIKANALPTL